MLQRRIIDPVMGRNRPSVDKLVLNIQLTIFLYSTYPKLSFNEQEQIFSFQEKNLSTLRMGKKAIKLYSIPRDVKQPEDSMAEMIAYLDDNSFDQTIRSGAILVDFYADWCGPCRMLAPVLEQVAKEMQGKVVIAKLDIDKNQKAASTYQVTSVPTMILFKNGKEMGRLVGVRDAAGVKQFISTAI